MLHKINKDFDNLTEEELIGVLNQGGLSEKEFESLVKAMKAKGLSGTIMTVEDPDSEEAKASIEYIEYHKKLPKKYILANEIKRANEILFSPKASLEDKKQALLILAHTGDIEAYKILEKYERNPDPELKIWINLAVQECQSFLQKDILGRPVISVGKVTKVGRNEPCPCGSGKKYKKCCGK